MSFMKMAAVFIAIASVFILITESKANPQIGKR